MLFSHIVLIMKQIRMAFVLIAVFWAAGVQAQLVLKPIPSFENLRPHYLALSRTEEDTSRLRLPFWDDFSLSSAQADTSKWMPQGGVFINNNFTNGDPPSLNVATFDGLNYLGEPYNFVEPKTVGFRDQLESRKIDLSLADAGQNLCISFFWQFQGLGESPDIEDYLELQFKDKDANWVSQWKKNGGDLSKKYSVYITPIIEARYFHRDFQFRFRSYGRLSGGFDTWNLDYVYMNKRRTVLDTAMLDIATSRNPSSYLKRYRAMPIKQFYANPKAETTDTIRCNLRNLHNNFNTLKYDCILTELETGQKLGVLQDTSDYIEQFENFYAFGMPLDSLPKNRKKMTLEYKFRVNTGAGTPYAGINLRVNDTISGRTVLDNYYAYDDGSPEYGIGVDQKFGKFAYLYDLNTADVLTHIDLTFIPLGIDLKGETLNLYVWKKLNSDNPAQDSVLLVQNILLKYPDTLGRFSRIRLNRPLQLNGSFFIGFEQLNEKNIVLGYDRNSDSRAKMYYNVANKWEQPRTLALGSVMMRPVFAGGDAAVGLEEELPNQWDLNVFPNPTQGKIRVQGRCEMLRLSDLMGNVIFEKSYLPDENEKEIDLNERIPNGLYFLQIQYGKQRTVKKIVLAK
jgi:Secretion system C-terminal sorting domain